MGRHHSLLQTQDSKDKQLFNYLCIRIPIDKLKKALSPWQQTSHSLYHRLSVCLPTESHPCGTEGSGGEGRYHILVSPVFTTIFTWYNAPSSLFYSPSHPLIPPCNFHALVLSFSHTASTPLSILTSSHLSSKAISPSPPHLLISAIHLPIHHPPPPPLVSQSTFTLPMPGPAPSAVGRVNGKFPFADG